MTPKTLDAPVTGALPSRSDILSAANHASCIVAPVWPLQHFVAVNPFLGLTDHTFADAAKVMGAVAGARLLMPRAYYAEALQTGRMNDAHIAAAIRTLQADGMLSPHLPNDATAVRAALGNTSVGFAVVPTTADVIGSLTGTALPRVVTERISAWASTYFDAGQASGKSPWRDLPPYGAWKIEACIDRTPDVLGIRGFRKTVQRMPDTAADAIVSCVARLGIPSPFLHAYLQRLTMSVAGWAAYARYQVWNSELHGEENDTLLQLLAVRLAWEVAIVEAYADRGAREAWRTCMATAAEDAPNMAAEQSLALDLVLQTAFELAYQGTLVHRINAHASAPRTTQRARPAVQAAFCIDVRSEVFRRHLEAVAPDVETIGFAGFFGFPIEYIPAGQDAGGAQCPVLLAPKVVVAEVVTGAPADATQAVSTRRQVSRWSTNLWKSFKQGAISCFGFVGPVGLAYGRKLVTDTLGLTRPVPHPQYDGIDAAARAALGPTLAMSSVADRATGLASDDRLAMAATVLGAMSLTTNFGRLVLLAGHGSTTVNNPHATGLDCGACGGHTGEANARVAVAVLNDPDVRRGLVARGIPLTDDTVFLAGLHDTTTDDVVIFDEHAVPATHTEELTRLKQQLAQAGKRTRAERALLLSLESTQNVDAQVLARSKDWAQVRPEWGLAGCAAFVAAPRHRTAGLDLGGRSFLHSYVWQQDDGFGVLELIMVAPMVVASWINLQYYGSTVDNDAFGSGNKVLHNVVGTIGVFEGNGGDLRTGLPWQSVHDGTRFVHEPLRLNVVIEAPIAAMNDVIAKHESVRQLLDNGWVHLWAMDAQGRVSQRYAGGLQWTAATSAIPVGSTEPAAA